MFFFFGSRADRKGKKRKYKPRVDAGGIRRGAARDLDTTTIHLSCQNAHRLHPMHMYMWLRALNLDRTCTTHDILACGVAFTS